MNQIQLGNSTLQVSPQGFGAMKNFGPEGAELLRKVSEYGVNFFDTAEMYGSGLSEEALGAALKGRRDQFVVATKVGCTFDEQGLHLSATPEYVAAACAKSLQRLGIETIDLYYLHRVDPKTPLEKTIEAMKKLVEEGKVRALGLSEVTAEQIERAHRIHPISAVQIEYSFWSREDEKNGVIDTCHRLGITVVAYSPLGRAFFVGENGKEFFQSLDAHDFRQYLPRYKEELAANLAVRARLEEYASSKGMKMQQLALGWIMGKGMIPIPGTTSLAHFEENWAARRLEAMEVAAVDAILDALSFAGQRYPGPEISGIFPEGSG